MTMKARQWFETDDAGRLLHMSLMVSGPEYLWVPDSIHVNFPHGRSTPTYHRSVHGCFHQLGLGGLGTGMLDKMENGEDAAVIRDLNAMLLDAVATQATEELQMMFSMENIREDVTLRRSRTVRITERASVIMARQEPNAQRHYVRGAVRGVVRRERTLHRGEHDSEAVAAGKRSL